MYNDIKYRMYKKPMRFFHFFDPKIFFKNDPTRDNMRESIVRISEAWKRFPDFESGNQSVCIEAKFENF